MRQEFVLVLTIALAFAVNVGTASGLSPESKTITEVLREPLPPEDLSCLEGDLLIVVQGPTFTYTVDKTTGAIAGLEVMRQGETVAQLREPAELWLDDMRLTGSSGTTSIHAMGKDQVILVSEGNLGANVPYTLRHTFYNDGVVVSETKLKPNKDVPVSQGIRYEVRATGRFSQYLHKRRDTNGMDCLKGALPEAGHPVDLPTLTSCLEVFGHEAALAVFTDRGGAHRSPADLATASLLVDDKKGDDASVVLTQHVIRIASGGPAYMLRAGDEFTFRTGLAVAPNRLPHPRWRDLRMFIWIGDQNHPYPSDEEIFTAARLGFTLFQMHRLGTPGVPRPPAGEFDRVLETVHEAGMLFIWTASADLMYANAQGVVDLKAAGKWPLWQGFNYGGAYTASMDPYCDLAATCLASPNGLADYRIECKARMLDNYAVDGMYIDDNLPYANCTLWKEHGHPEKTYDCLIELHDMNWRRRQILLSKCPHAVLIDHCSRGFVLPAISAFDCHLFGEGYSFSSIDSYWDTFGTFQNMPAQGCLWAGDTESTRCGTQAAYTFDLLTGGGQYSYLDWRLWPEKFPYASGVDPIEVQFVQVYNTPQYYFGMYESKPYYFASSRDLFTTTAENTHATIYHNQIWNDWLIAIANVGEETVNTSLVFKEALLPLFSKDRRFAVHDVHRRSVTYANGGKLAAQFGGVGLAPFAMRLFQVRETPKHAVFHLWGGKRLTEHWGNEAGSLTVQVQGPPGLRDWILFGVGDRGIDHVTVNGRPAEFLFDPDGQIAGGRVLFSLEPITIRVMCTNDGTCKLRKRAIHAD